MECGRSFNFFQAELLLSGEHSEIIFGKYPFRRSASSLFDRFSHQKLRRWYTNVQEQVIFVSTVCRAMGNAYCVYTVQTLQDVSHANTRTAHSLQQESSSTRRCIVVRNESHSCAQNSVECAHRTYGTFFMQTPKYAPALACG